MHACTIYMEIKLSQNMYDYTALEVAAMKWIPTWTDNLDMPNLNSLRTIAPLLL